jgi:hypothetical protein
MNMAEKRIMSARDWLFLWKQYTLTTTAGTQSYVIPAYTNKPQGLYVTVGSYRYVPKEITNREEWDKLNEVVISSDIVSHYFFYDGAINLYPTPATSSNVITFNGRRIAKDLSIADFTTGTITTATNGSTAIVGSGTSWTVQMAGRWIRITDSSVANTGDGYWYEIASVGSSTTLTLVRKYGGTSIAAGSATYTMGQVSLIPEPHDMLPIYEALKVYYTSVDPSTSKSELYAKMYIEGYDQLVRDWGSKVNVVLDDGNVGNEINNPNLYVSL